MFAFRQSIIARIGIAAVILVGVVVVASALTDFGAGPAGAKITTNPCQACKGFAVGQPLKEPQRLVTSGGKLDVTLTAATSTVTIGGRRVTSQVYNGQFPGPTLVVDPGDQMNVLLRNRLPADYLAYGASAKNPPPQFPGQPYAGYTQPLGQLTNLHVHGLHVSPNKPQDDVLLSLKSGQNFQYRYQLPSNHPAGLFWYHPHHHRYTDEQVSAGQAGMIIVRGGLDDLPALQGIRERLMVFQNPQVKDGATTGAQYQVPKYRLITINGQVQPRIDIQPGETQRWRIANASTERFLRILPIGGASYWQIASDGIAMEKPQRIGELWLAPGQRMEVLVRAGLQTGAFPLIQSAFSQRPTPYGKQPRVQVATLRVVGDPVEPKAIPTTLLPAEDLRGSDVKIARKRTITFTQSPPKFYIDGKLFEDHGGHAGPVITTKLNTVEEWTIFNNSPEWHNFHIHTDPYQVVARNGKELVGQPLWADSIAVAPGEKLALRLPFRDFTGTFVLHCHVLVHEDHGMMTVVKVVK